uniref:Pentatricopeptide repeat-containing protein At4g16390ic n=1 Tax=Rhizophora mucronata TaxID=61149 RepID=A0A2P2J5U3_RHIMU
MPLVAFPEKKNFVLLKLNLSRSHTIVPWNLSIRPPSVISYVRQTYNRTLEPEAVLILSNCTEWPFAAEV